MGPVLYNGTVEKENCKNHATVGSEKAMKEHFVITVGREYGSGGRAIAKLVAQKLNVPFYDK